MPSSRLPQRQFDHRESPDKEPERLPQPSAPRPDLIDVLVTIACFLGAGFAVGLLASALGLNDVSAQSSAVLVPLVLAAQSLLFFAVFLVTLWQGRGLSLRLLGLGPMPPGWFRRGAVWGLGAILPAIAINAVTLILLGGEQTNPQVEILAPAGPTLWGFLLVLPLAAVLVPFVEELAFRGVLYGWLRQQLPTGFATVASAAVFAVAHGIPQLIPALLLVGIMLARLREQADSLWPCIAMHGVFNGVMTVILFAALSAGVEPTQSL